MPILFRIQPLEVVPTEMNLRHFPTIQFDGVDEVVLGVAGDRPSVVEFDVYDLGFAPVILIVGAAFFVEYEFDFVADLV